MAETTVNVRDAKTSLSRPLARVEQGDRTVIARAGRPVAVLSAVQQPRRRRNPGHDRIVIQAIITADRAIARYGVDTIW